MSEPADIPSTASAGAPPAWRERALERYLRGAEPQDRPRAVLVAGQPGAGKGPITEEIARHLARRGYVVIVDTDELKYLHPSYASLAGADDRDVMPEIGPEICAIAAELTERAVALRTHLVVEGPLDDPQAATELVARLKQGGYHVTVIALRVDPETSWRGIQERFARQQEAFEVGAWTEQSEHDRAAQTLPASLEALERQALADEFYLIARDGTRLVSVAGPEAWEAGACRREFRAQPPAPAGTPQTSAPESSQAKRAPEVAEEQAAAKEIWLDGKRRLRLGAFAKPVTAGPEVKPPAAASAPTPQVPASGTVASLVDASGRPAKKERKVKLGTFTAPSTPASEPAAPRPPPPAPAARELPPPSPPPRAEPRTVEPPASRPPPARPVPAPVTPVPAPPTGPLEPAPRKPKRRRPRPEAAPATTAPPPAPAETHETSPPEASSEMDLSAYPPEQQRAIRRRMELQEKLRRRIEEG